MLGDGICQFQCLSESCHFDRGDCDASLCSAGCLSSMINDDTCDEACYVEACEWDGSDCDCAPGCTSELLANEDCDPQCNTESCGWDGVLCGCAPGCSFSDLGECKPQCLVEDCNFDSLPGFPVCLEANRRRAVKAYRVAQLALGHFHADLLNFGGTCQSVQECVEWNSAVIASVGCLIDECRNPDCEYMFSDCSVLPNCAGAFWSSGQYACVECVAPLKNSFGACGEECAPGFVPHPIDSSLCVLEEDTTSEDRPQMVFVSASHTEPDADGSETRPFPLISQALKHATKHYSTVVLMDPEHLLTAETPSALLMIGNVPVITPFDNQWVVSILPYGCLSTPSCERVLVTRSRDEIKLVVPGYQDIAGACGPLPQAGQLRISNIDFTDEQGIGYDIFFQAHYGSLILRNVAIRGTASNFPLIALSFNNTILLENVDFVNVSCFSGCIVQKEKLCEEETPLSTIVYRGGTVTTVELSEFEKFIELGTMLSVTLEAVTFVGSSASIGNTALIAIDSSCLFVLANCTFANNTMAAKHAVSIVPASWALNSRIEQAHFAKYINATNIRISNVTFYNNSYTTGSALFFSFPKISQSVLIDRLVFDHEFSEISLLQAVSTKPVSQPDIRGQSYYFAPFQRIDFPPVFFHLFNVQVIYCSTGVKPAFFISQLAHIKISQVRVAYPSQLSKCAPLLWVDASYGVSISEVSVADVRCGSGMLGFRLAKLTGNTVLALASAFNIQAEAVLFAEQISNFAMIHSRVSNFSCDQEAFGAVQLMGNATTATLRNVTLENNSAGNGGALVASMTLQVTVINCTFSSNSAKNGGAMLLSPQGKVGTRLEVIDSIFAQNSASFVGGAIHILYNPPSSSLFLSVQTSNFTGNRAYQCAGLSVSAGIEMQVGSIIENSLFVRHFAEREGVLSLSYFFGNLQVINCLFTNNEGLEESAIYINHKSLRALSAISLLLNSVKFENNTGASTVYALDSDLSVIVFLESVEFVRNSRVALFVSGARVIASNATFRGNTGATGPALTLDTAAQGTFADSLFEGNAAQSSAGAVLNTESSVFSCTTCRFLENEAGLNGGAIGISQKAVLVLSSAKIVGNRASGHGSALYFLLSTENSTMINSTIQLNSAGSSGSIHMFFSALSIDACMISENTAQSSPGILLSLSTLSVSKSEFASQYGESGWFLHMLSLSTCYINFTTFRDGSGASMGALYLEEGAVFATNSLFLNLSARFGSGAYVLSRASLTLSNCSFVEQLNTKMGVATIAQTQAVLRDCRFLNYSGSAIWGQNAILQVNQSEFESESHTGGKGSLGVGLYCDECPATTIEKSAFSALEGLQGSGISLSSRGSEWGRHDISDCTFSKLIGQIGAAVQVVNVHLAARKNSFLHNAATQSSGGAIQLSCDSADCRYVLQENVFVNNRAVLNGGAIAWIGAEPELVANIFDSNKAQYGDDFSSFPTHIATTNTTTLPPTPSGQNAPYYLIITLRDHYDQIVTTENDTKAVLIPVDSQTTRVSGITELTAIKGEFKFDSFIVEAQPETSTQLRVRLLDLNSEIVFTVPMRACVIGESFEDNKCVLCEAGKYSFDPAESCQDCISGAVCEGNFTVIPKPGYWRADYRQAVIFECPNQEACIGRTLTGMCAEGYVGNKCQTCANRYFRVSKSFCSPCPSKAASLAKLIFIFSGISIFAIIVVITSISSAQRMKAKASVYLKILMNYLQLVMLMGAFNLSWPSYVKKLLEIQDSAGGFAEQLASAQCLSDDYDESSEFYMKTVVMAAIPVGVTVFSSLVWVLIGLISRKYEKMHRELVGSAVALFFLVHPSVMRVMFAVFSCEEIRAGEYWITGLRLRCWADEHWKYAFGVALPSIIVWGAGVPAAILIVLVVKRKQLSQVRYKMRFGFLYNGYRQTRYYWEFVVIYRKLVIISLSVFLSRVAVLRQALLALLVLLFSQHLHKVSQPYTNAALNTAEHRSLLVSTVTLFAGLYYLSGLTSEVLNILFFLSVIGVNVHFLQYWVRQSASAWLLLVVKRVKCLQRFCVEVGEERIMFRSRREATTENRSSLLQVKKRKLPDLLLRLYFGRLNNQLK